MRTYATLLLVFLAACAAARGGDESSETKTFPARHGDTVVVRNDHGRVRVHGNSDDQVRVTTHTMLVGAGTDQVVVTTRKTADGVLLHSAFRDTPGESVDFDVSVPRFINVVVSGAAPEVLVQEIDGYVRVSTVTGRVTAENFTSSASLMSDRGDITARLRRQPAGDTRIETVDGRIACEIAPSLSLRVWARAGAGMVWGDEAQATTKVLEKQLGSGGYLLYLGSLHGSVRVDTGGVPAAPRMITQAAPSRDSVPRAETPAAQGEQRPVERELRRGATYRIAVDSVLLTVSVRDRAMNRSLSDLWRGDFLVYEDGVEQNVEHFETTEVPFNLLLLLDVSGSTEPYLHLIKRASIDFTQQLKESDRIAVASFNTSVQFLQDFTRDRELVSRAIGSIRSGGGTSFYDALEACARDFMRDVEGRKAIVVFTDGVDNRLDVGQGSGISFERVFADIQELDPIIYPIFLDTGAAKSAGVRRSQSPWSRNERTPYEKAKEQLQMIADQTGGRMYSPRRVQDLGGVYSEIADDLRIQYRVGYSPTNTKHDGSWRSVQVKIKNRPDAVARTRKGYYARPAGRP